MGAKVISQQGEGDALLFRISPFSPPLPLSISCQSCRLNPFSSHPSSIHGEQTQPAVLGSQAGARVWASGRPRPSALRCAVATGSHGRAPPADESAVIPRRGHEGAGRPPFPSSDLGKGGALSLRQNPKRTRDFLFFRDVFIKVDEARCRTHASRVRGPVTFHDPNTLGPPAPRPMHM